MSTSSCRTCGAPITWAVTEYGHRMPLDAVPPMLGGNVELTGRHDADRDLPVVKVHAVAVNRPGLFVSHFSTCEHAEQNRKPKLRPDGKRR